MGFEFISTFLLELLNSNVGRKVALSVSHLKSLDFCFSLQMMFPLLSTMNITELTGSSGVEATVLGHEVTQSSDLDRGELPLCTPASWLDGQNHCPHLCAASCHWGVDRLCECNLHVLGGD
jgi:hypothetical protein